MLILVNNSQVALNEFEVWKVYIRKMSRQITSDQKNKLELSAQVSLKSIEIIILQNKAINKGTKWNLLIPEQQPSQITLILQ